MRGPSWNSNVGGMTSGPSSSTTSPSPSIRTFFFFFFLGGGGGGSPSPPSAAATSAFSPFLDRLWLRGRRLAAFATGRVGRLLIVLGRLGDDLLRLLRARRRLAALDRVAQLRPERAPDLGHDVAWVRAREARLAQQRAVLAVVNGELRALLADLAGHDRGEGQLLGDLLEPFVVVEQRARVREANLHLARLREIEAVRLQDLHDLLAHQRFLHAVELRNADPFGRGLRHRRDESAEQQREDTDRDAEGCRRHASGI